MSAVAIDPSGVLVIEGAKTFPIVLSNPPFYDPSRSDPPPVPQSMTTPDGGDALAEVASAGVNLLRLGTDGWSAAALDAQLSNQEAWLDAAAARDLFGWLWLGGLPNLPPAGDLPSMNEVLLRRVAQRLRNRPGLAAYKGIDEPANVFRPTRIPAAGLKRAHDVLKQVDPGHPVVVIQSPRSTGDLGAYAPALDITGADIYPIAYPPGLHASPTPSEDLGVVGDLTTTMTRAARGKPVWMTLQIAWSGVTREGATLRFPTFPQERFMAYHAIVRGARGLVFFGGHITRVGTPPNVRPICTAVDIEHGWNWRFWRRVLRPLVEELSARSDLHPALIAPASAIAATCRTVDASGAVTPQTPPGVEFVVRETATSVFLIAVKRGGQTTQMQFRLPGTRLAPTGRVLFEPPRTVPVTRAGGASSFRDWLGPYEAHVYLIERA